VAAPLKLVKDLDYYLEGDKFVFTAHYLLKRGFCCNSGCRHCPYREGAPAVVGPGVRIVDKKG
jgi:hypothetical protein